MFKPISGQHQTYLRDESRFKGAAQSIAFPRTKEEALDAVGQCLADAVGITVQGSRSGLCGGAAPLSGRIINLSQMNRPQNLEIGPDGTFLLKVQPGYLLSGLRRDLKRRKFDWLEPIAADSGAARSFSGAPEHFWPPDPSELTASIGGLISTNARGPAAYKYGSAGDHIQGLEVILPCGQMTRLDRESADFKADYLAALIGGEGMFGLITSLTLRLQPKPAEIWGICFFFNDESGGANFVDEALRLGLKPLAAFDFIDNESLMMVASFKETADKLREIPNPPAQARVAVYLELHAETETEMEEAAEALMAQAVENGGAPDESWALSGDEVDKLRLFRHAVPEAANARVDCLALSFPGATKLGTDITLPQFTFTEALAYYRQTLAEHGLRAAIFGHCPGNHLHVNLFPENEKQRLAADTLLARWLKESLAQKGRLFGEHGVGKVKKDLAAALSLTAEPPLKTQLDPKGLFNPGNGYYRGN